MADLEVLLAYCDCHASTPRSPVLARWRVESTPVGVGFGLPRGVVLATSANTYPSRAVVTGPPRPACSWTARLRASAVSSGNVGLIAIPEPSSKPAGIARRGTMRRCQTKYSRLSSPGGALWMIAL